MKREVTTDALKNVFVTAGTMGGLIQQYDWATSKLGAMEDWPQSLQSAVSICINSNFPIAIYWGIDLVLIYNDAWSPIPGNKHPWALGKPAIEVWPEIWADIEPQFQKAFSGVPGGSKDALLPMQRHGYTEECYFDFTFTPIYGASGNVEGIFNAVIETTYRVINERRSLVLQNLSDSINSVLDREQVFAIAGRILASAEADISFFGIVEYEGGNHAALKAASFGFKDPERWPIGEVRDGSLKFIADIGEALEGIGHSTWWPERPREAVVLPLKRSDGVVFACLIAGLSAGRRFDKDYRAFFESIATVLSGELNTIQALAEERMRAQALAEIDKAKTVFFSNISHELRTPLALMMGPLQSLLEQEDLLEGVEREKLEIAFRNTRRLQKLVNALLDYARIEAGKMEARVERLEIVKYTIDLASSFRSVIESAGLEYEVHAECHDAIADVDADMWEKIVLNLISNAFKYTRQGTVKVHVGCHEGNVRFSVTDTGVGIGTEDQPRIFERFYRVNSADGRSQEGTGIGLALVREMVQLLKGRVEVQSEPGKGSTFTVVIPAAVGTARRHPAGTEQGVSAAGSYYVEEALQWRDDLLDSGDASPVASNGLRPRVLLADDNKDMRLYLQRLMEGSYDVRAVSDGQEAFAAALDWMPDLIISDVMMPKEDGFALVNRLKGSLVTRNIPVILLSARAGEEAKVAGILAGADDYLVKPFSARELLARVANQLAISSTRRKTEKEFYNLFMQTPAHIHVMKGPDHVMEFFHPLGRKFLGGRDITGMKIREALPEVEGQGYFEMLDQVYTEGKTIQLPEAKATLPNEAGVMEDHYFSITYLPLRDVAGKIEGVLQFSTDVSQHVSANQKIKESEERFRLLVTSIPQIIWIADNNSNIEFLSQQWEAYTGVSVDDGRKKFSSYIHADDIGRVRARWHESIRTKTPWKEEYRLIDVRTNKYRWFFGHTLPLIDDSGEVIKWIGSAADITLQKEAHEALEALVAERTSELTRVNSILQSKNEELVNAQTFLRTVLDASVELVTAFDKDFRLTFVNSRVKALFNKTPDELVGKRLQDIRPGIEQQEGFAFLQRALKGETVHVPSRRSNDNNSLVFETFVIPLRRDDEITGVVAMQRDITAMVRLTEDLRLSNERLKRSNDDLQQFAHVTSHDLKEPVRKIKMYGSMLRNDYAQFLPDKGAGYLDKIERAATRISAMIDGVLKYSSVEGNDEPPVPVSIAYLLKSIGEDLEMAIHESSARIEYHALPTIMGVQTLLYQLFYNLIYNSIKFRSTERTPVITVAADDDTVEQRSYTRIDVTDNGIGFDPTYADKIFDSFSRLYSKDKYEGTGLGLALCKKIAIRHGGMIKATARENEGAKFSVWFPKEIVV